VLARVLVPVLVVGLAGCERGCLSNWLTERGVGGDKPVIGKGSLPVQGVDCPDGLARCEDGVVRVSRAYSYPVPCKESPEQCTCPWVNVGACERGCVAESIELVMRRALAAEQLCAPASGSAAGVLARPPDPAFEVRPGWCEGESYRCEGGAVVACVDSPSALAACVKGCAEEGTTVDEEIPHEAAIAILCAH
jgi:hypothetical protein